MHRDSLHGASYASLDEVYQTTTIPTKCIKKGRKAYQISKMMRRSFETIFNRNNSSDMTDVLKEEDSILESKIRPIIMPHANSEEASLLQSPENMDGIELKSVNVVGKPFALAPEAQCFETRVHTDCGDLVVAVQGQRGKPAIFTYHDLGLNYTSFKPFFNFVDMRALLENFCVYHINAPGQEKGALTYPEDYVYPSIDELAHQINFVMTHFGVASFIGFGVGVGANILARFALARPQAVDALALVNCTSSQAGWVEWAYQKMNARTLRSHGVTQAVLDYLMWHHFGRFLNERNPDLTATYRTMFTRNSNPVNLSKLIEAYVRRTPLGISRDGPTLKVPVLNVTGALSPHVEDTVTFNGRLNPNNSTWMKICDCGMVLEEQPRKMAEAFRLFLQGEGYAVLQLQKLDSCYRSDSMHQIHLEKC